ncbi:uncharacterized protein LOC143827354 [Paroedura picta]|uniref:uncharacterized protein LOC143827354 n=1 Tax=Paroedura picta TaxID=143630 RepID=UPI0040575DFA
MKPSERPVGLPSRVSGWTAPAFSSAVPKVTPTPRDGFSARGNLQDPLGCRLRTGLSTGRPGPNRHLMPEPTRFRTEMEAQLVLEDIEDIWSVDSEVSLERGSTPSGFISSWASGDGSTGSSEDITVVVRPAQPPDPRLARESQEAVRPQIPLLRLALQKLSLPPSPSGPDPQQPLPLASQEALLQGAYSLAPPRMPCSGHALHHRLICAPLFCPQAQSEVKEEEVEEIILSPEPSAAGPPPAPP